MKFKVSIEPYKNFLPFPLSLHNSVYLWFLLCSNQHCRRGGWNQICLFIAGYSLATIFYLLWTTQVGQGSTSSFRGQITNKTQKSWLFASYLDFKNRKALSTCCRNFQTLFKIRGKCILLSQYFVVSGKIQVSSQTKSKSSSSLATDLRNTKKCLRRRDTHLSCFWDRFLQPPFAQWLEERSQLSTKRWPQQKQPPSKTL